MESLQEHAVKKRKLTTLHVTERKQSRHLLRNAASMKRAFTLLSGLVLAAAVRKTRSSVDGLIIAAVYCSMQGGKRRGEREREGCEREFEMASGTHDRVLRSVYDGFA